MWNPKTELLKQAIKIVKDKHTNGFNKPQLIEASKEVFGGYGVTQAYKLDRRPIRTMEDVGNMGNAMAQIDGNYPTGMSCCEVVGINGGCGPDCPCLLNGECKYEDGREINGKLKSM